MTAAHNTFKWTIWSHENLQGASDEFVTKGFRVQLTGLTIELSFEGSGACSPDSAKSLAEKYVETLAKHMATSLSLITEAEWLQRTAPPFGQMTTLYGYRESRDRVVNAVREARNDLLASEDKTLRGCYDYLQDARDRMYTVIDEAAYDAYKAIELLEEEFGGERKAIAVLGKILKKAKTTANQKRHIPRKGQQPKASAESVELTRQVVRKYERYLLDRTVNVRLGRE
jgi:hypothetical protein